MRIVLLAALLVPFGGCTTAPVPDEPPADVIPATQEGRTTPLPTRPGGTLPTGASPSPTSALKPLSDFEDQLAGTWRRYHEKNSGEWNEYWYYEYIDFNEDRKACIWRYGYESSSDSDEGLFDSNDYSPWEITREMSGNSFLVTVKGRGLDYVFDFTRDRVYPSGFDTLIFVPTTDGKSCVARDGPSY